MKTISALLLLLAMNASLHGQTKQGFYGDSSTIKALSPEHKYDFEYFERTWETNRPDVSKIPAPVYVKPGTLSENKLVSFDKLLFIQRKTYTSSHYYTNDFDGSNDMGGSIATLDLKTKEVTRVSPPEMSTGSFGNLDLSYDGRQVIFDWTASSTEGYRIY
jgi:hypothetical protein